MRLTTFGRIARGMVSPSGRDATRGVWELANRLATGDGRQRAFARYVIEDFNHFIRGGPTPVAGETWRRAHLAAQWLARAQDVTHDDGLSYGYFPFKTATGWRESYPETTGYTVPTLLAFGAAAGEPEFSARALRMARFTAGCQMPSGAVYGGVVRAAGPRVAVAFNTGMALLGFSAAYRHTADPAFLQSTRRAADFLVSDLDAEGYFRSHGPFVERHARKTYTCLCAWPLYLAGEDCGDARYAEGAIRAGDAVLRQQRDNGWFADNCLSRRVDAPLLHTIGYTLQGLVELAIASRQRRYLEAAIRGMEGLLSHCDRGFLYGRWFPDWQPASFSSCLTGAAQIALVCYRLHEHTGEPRYRRAADRVLDYLKALQPTDAGHRGEPEIVGALGGSFPLVGAYMSNGFPGWATKFFLDALLHQVSSSSAAVEPMSERTFAVASPEVFQ